MRFMTPVFGADGVEIGQMPIGQGEPTPLPTLRDVSAEAEARNEAIDEAFAEINPRLYDARSNFARAQQTTQGFVRQVQELREAMQQLRPLSPDAPIGMAAERAQQMRALQEQLSELEQEVAAAGEEEKAAMMLVTRILQEGA